MENGTMLIPMNQLINTQLIYKLLIEYFNNPTLTKLKTDENYNSHYYGQIRTQLLGEKYYIIVIVHDDDSPLYYQKEMKQLNWNSIQFRKSKNDYTNVEKVNINDNDILDSYKLYVEDRTLDYTYYTNLQLGIKIYLLHDKTNSKYQYPDQTDLRTVIHEFQTLIEFI